MVVPKDRMDMNKPIHAYGIDSHTAAGLRSWFAKAFGVSTAVFEILAGASSRELGSAAAKKYKEKEKEMYKENGEEMEEEKEENGEEEMEGEGREEKEKTEAGEDSENRIRST